MKKWTVVIEINLEEHPDVNKYSVEKYVASALRTRGYEDFRVMETIPAPYGPQHPGGVFITESKCTCRPGSVFQDKKCVARVHRP